MTIKLGEKRMKNIKDRGCPIITRDGLLYRRIDLPEADIVAREYGYNYAEEMVKELRHHERKT